MFPSTTRSLSRCPSLCGTILSPLSLLPTRWDNVPHCDYESLTFTQCMEAWRMLGPLEKEALQTLVDLVETTTKTMNCQIMVGNAVFVFLWLKLFFSFTRGKTWHEVTQCTCHNWWNCHTWLNEKCVKIYGCIPTEIQPHLEAAEMNKNTRINKDYCMEKDVFFRLYTLRKAVGKSYFHINLALNVNVATFTVCCNFIFNLDIFTSTLNCFFVTCL